MTSESPDPLDYERALAAAGLGDVVIFHRQTTGSTSDDARALVSAGRLDPGTKTALIVAEGQTQGRGRGASVWFSPTGSIAMTVTTDGVAASRLGVLSLGAGVCVAKALRQLGAKVSLKWPNDVLLGGLKVCGILCESSLLAGVARVFIGIGINVEAGPANDSIAAQATTLKSHGFEVDRPALVADITARILSLIRESRPNADVVEEWMGLAEPWWGHEATLIEAGLERRVTLLDVNPEGQLVVRDEAGVVRSLLSGEVRRIRTAGS